MLDQGKSISCIAKIMDVDVQTAMAWAAKAGHQPLRRPTVFKQEMLPGLIDALRTVIGKADAAQRFFISVETVTRILRSEVGLQAAWHQARAVAAQERARNAWQFAVSQSPHIGIQALRALVPGAYAWLYRNDRHWLQTQCQILRSRPPPLHGDRLNWHLRAPLVSSQSWAI